MEASFTLRSGTVKVRLGALAIFPFITLGASRFGDVKSFTLFLHFIGARGMMISAVRESQKKKGKPSLR